MRCFLGVDSGGTKTRAVIASVEGKILGSAVAGSTDIVNAGKENAAREICECVAAALKNAGIGISELEYSCFAMSGYGDVESAYGDINYAVDSVMPVNRVIINDVRAALEGAIPLEPGIVVLAGTGAMCMAKNSSGEIFRTDGWGEHIGDLGSAYYIGQNGLREAFKSFDGRSPKGELFSKALQYSFEGGCGNEENPAACIKRITDRCKGKNIRAYIAGFGEKVDQAAELGDRTAKKILESAADELFGSLRSVAESAGLNICVNKAKVSFVGSVFRSRILKSYLMERIKLYGFEYAAPAFDPEYGALIYASENWPGRMPVEEFVKNLAENIRRISL